MPIDVIEFIAYLELSSDSTAGLELNSSNEADAQQPVRSFQIVESAELDDGQRVMLSSDRGWSDGKIQIAYPEFEDATRRLPRKVILPFDYTDPWVTTTRAGLTETLLGVLEPDGDESWYQRLAERLAENGINVDIADVESAPYRIEFGPILENELRRRALMPPSASEVIIDGPTSEGRSSRIR